MRPLPLPVRLWMSLVLGLVAGASPLFAEDTSLAAELRELDGRVIPADSAEAKQLGRMLGREVHARLQAANRRETWARREVQTRAEWERFRDVRLQALRQSLGSFPQVPKDLKVQVARTLDGDGYKIQNLVFESRPGLLVSANLYAPAKPASSMPGILICHSHHSPKTQGELQDMGMTWARLGCLVLVMDQLGHGERRQHPFRDSSSYPHPFKAGHQDYYFRYNTALQLHLVGESLVGWMVWDLMRGVDLLLSRPGIDKERIILLGAVAGGGDPAAVAAALDPRITVVAPFNFGGPQPENVYPLPANADDAFNYAGSGSWESTRNLRLSARDGFLPWVIVAVAPRRLIYGHEFSWDQEHDPVWKRLEKIYEVYGARDHLTSVHGRGKVTGQPPESTHCNNIGPVHRRQIYPALKSWFGMAEPDKEYQKRRPVEELLCLTPEVAAQVKPKPLHELAAALGDERTAAARRQLAELPANKRRNHLRKEWAALLGDVRPAASPKVSRHDKQQVQTITIARVALQVEQDITVPLFLLVPAHGGNKARLPVVIGLAQAGKQKFLRERAEVIAQLLAGGAAVCLPDLRGTGETAPGDSHGRTSASTSLSSSEQMLGQTLLGARLRDLLAVMDYLTTRDDLDDGRVALWGDSFSPANPADRNVNVPLDADPFPAQAEPLGGLLALLGALFDENVRAVFVRGGLTGYRSLLEGPFVYVPHDVVVPGALTAGDLCDVAAVLAPRSLRLDALVDGRNRTVASAAISEIFHQARAVYDATGSSERLAINSGSTAAEWLLAQLKNK